MAEIVIYSKTTCPYCVKAKTLLNSKGREDYSEFNIQTEAGKMEEMLEKTGGARTVPQIFIGETHVGGCDDLYALNDEGKLDDLLAS